MTLDPLLEAIYRLSEQINRSTDELTSLAVDDEFVARLRAVPVVGPLVSLAFIA